MVIWLVMLNLDGLIDVTGDSVKLHDGQSLQLYVFPSALVALKFEII